MPRYKLRTLLLLLAILPPLLWIGWTKYEAWRTEKSRREAFAAHLAALQAAAPAKIQAMAAAMIAANSAEQKAKAAARREEMEARVQEQMDDQAELDDLIRRDCLPAHAVPRIQSRPPNEPRPSIPAR